MLLYFVPGGTLGVDRPQLIEAGIGYAFEGPTIGRRQVTCGPSGNPGLIMAADPPEDAAVGYYPDRQRWQAIAGSAAWVGLETERPPTPDELSRAQPLRGHWIGLADDQQYLVPTARCWVEEDGELRWVHGLPRTSQLDAEGRWSAGEILPRYATLWQYAVRWEEARFGVSLDEPTKPIKDAQELSFQDAHQAAVVALAANYRLGPTEVSLLGLLTAELAVTVLDALIDLPTREAWVKKKLARDGTSTAVGPAD
jgi:hypothetical protein